MEEAGAKVDIVSPQKGSVKAWDKDHWSIEWPVDEWLDDVQAEDYDALVLPGGVLNPDQLRQNKKAVEFAQQFLKTGTCRLQPLTAALGTAYLTLTPGVILRNASGRCYFPVLISRRFLSPMAGNPAIAPGLGNPMAGNPCPVTSGWK